MRMGTAALRGLSPSRAIVGTTALVASGAVTLVLWQNAGAMPPPVQSADFFPFLLSLCLAIVGLVLLVQAVLAVIGADRSPSTDAGPNPSASVPVSDPGDMGPVEAPCRLAGVMLCVLGFYVAIEPFGMMTTAVVVIALLAPILGYRRPIVIAIVAIVLPLLVWLLFRKVLLVLLPTGRLLNGWF